MGVERFPSKEVAGLIIFIVMLIVLFSIVGKIVSLTGSDKELNSFKSFVAGINDMSKSSLNTKTIGQLYIPAQLAIGTALEKSFAVVQVYGADDFSGTRPDGVEVLTSVDDYDIEYSGTTKSCIGVLNYLYDLEIASERYGDICRDKYCMCFAELKGYPLDISPKGVYQWWGYESGDFNDYALNLMLFEKGIEFAYNGYTGSEEGYTPNNPEYYDMIQNAVANNCFEFFGVNNEYLSPSNVFVKVACSPIEGTDTESRPLFFSGVFDIQNKDMVLLWMHTESVSYIEAATLVRENTYPEIGADFLVN